MANRAAVESCHSVLALLSQQQDPALLRSIASETGEACAKFRKVVSLLSNGGPASSAGGRGGHARGRLSGRRKPMGFLSQKGFLESSSNNTPLGMLMSASSTASPSPSAGSAVQLRPQFGAPPPPGIDLVSSGSKSAHQFGPPKMVQPLSVQFQFGATAHRFPFQQQQQHKLLHGQMFKRSNSAVSLKFDSPSGGTSTMSSPRSFMSSLITDGSVASLDGKPPMHLICGPAASDPLNARQGARNKRQCPGRGEDGSGKCAASGKCHCSKRR